MFLTNSTWNLVSPDPTTLDPWPHTGLTPALDTRLSVPNICVAGEEEQKSKYDSVWEDQKGDISPEIIKSYIIDYSWQ